MVFNFKRDCAVLSFDVLRSFAMYEGLIHRLEEWANGRTFDGKEVSDFGIISLVPLARFRLHQ